MLQILISCFSVSVALSVDLTYTLKEETVIGYTIGNIANESGLNQILNDSDRNSIKYTILDSTYASYFSVNEKTSYLSVKKIIDRESLQECEFSLSCELLIEIVAQSTVGTFFKKIKVKIIIADINDHNPTFPENSMNLQISEAFVVGSSLPIAGAIDSDSGNNSVQSYYLQPNGTPFKLEYDKFVDGSSVVRLVVSQKLDRETVDRYQLKIVAEDGGDPKLTGTLNLNITITDVNDNAPSFNQSTYSVSVKEDTTVGSVILNIKATDPDLNENGMVTYRLSPYQSDNIKQTFAVDRQTGNVYTLKTLVYTSVEPYKVIIEANDGASIPLMSQATIFVTVLNSNNNPPQININLLSNSNVARISENASVGAAVAHVAVSDNDKDQNGNVTCILQHDVFKLDAIDKNEYKVVVSKPLDREKTEKYSVVITCQDAGSPPKSSTAGFDVQVLDVNDNRPSFLSSQYNVTILENNFIGGYVVKVSAIDLDIGVNAEIVYSLEPSPYDFQINPVSGEIFANFILDRENVSKMQFRVLARDNGSVPLTGTAVVSVTLLDINDNAPEFVKSVYVMYAKENEPPGYYVGEVIAHDRDDGANGVVYYIADPGNLPGTPFTVLPDGSIFTNETLDRETHPHGYSLNIIAYDQGIPSKNSTAHVTIFVEDENDNDPVIQFPTPENNTIQIVYEKPSNSVIANVKASDNDTGVNALLTYTILQADILSTFRINSKTGEISLARPLSMNDLRTYTFTIEVDDGGVPKRKDRQNLTVIISSNQGFAVPQAEPEKDNALIVIVIVCVTIILSGAIIMIIFLIRRMDRKKREKKAKIYASNKRNEKDMYDSINKNGSVPNGDVDHIEKRVSFCTTPVGMVENGQLSNGYLPEEESVTQIADRKTPPSSNYGRSVQLLKDKTQPNPPLKKGQTTKVPLHQNNLQPWPTQNGQVFTRKHEDNHSETSGETNDSGRGGSESDIHSSGCNQGIELDYLKNRYSPINSPGRPLLTEDSITKLHLHKERYRPQYIGQSNQKQHNHIPNGPSYLHKPNSMHWNALSDVLNVSMCTIDDYDDDTTTSGSYVVDEQDLDFETTLGQDCVV